MRSTVRTIPAASDDAVAPRPAIATPTSAAASAGASLMPSPTMITGPCTRSSWTTLTLSAGVCSERTSSTPTNRPTDSAASARSPVTSTIRRRPADRRPRSIRVASGRMESENSSAPAGEPSRATRMLTDPSRSASCRARRAHTGTSASRIHGALPIRTGRPSTTPSIPWPWTSTTSVGITRAIPRSCAARTIALASTCGEAWSRLAAAASRSPTATPGAVCTLASSGCPTVRVPVLSNSSTRPAASCSRTWPPLTTTPRRADCETPEMIATGTASSSGQGVATTRTATTRAESPLASHAAPARIRVSGTNHHARRSARRTYGEESAWAASTSRTTSA